MRKPYDNKRFPHTCVITRVSEIDPMEDEGESTIIYEGPCRCFAPRDTTVGGEYDTNYRKISVPENLSEWTAETIPGIYDIAIVNYGPYTEHMYIVDRKPTNLGTHFFCRKDERENEPAE